MEKRNKIQEKLEHLMEECYNDILALIREYGDDNSRVWLDEPVSVYFEDCYGQITTEDICAVKIKEGTDLIEYTFESDWDYWRDDLLDNDEITDIFNLQEALFNQFNK